MPDWCFSFNTNGEVPAQFGSLSPAQKFIVAGDIWLSNRNELPLDTIALSDQEIVAQLWERFGADAVLRLQGMFAFVVWDCEQKKLSLVRDCVGTRTLYYSINGATISVAPRLQTLARKFKPGIDLTALRDYLSCAFVPGARTMWEGIREIRPGTILSWPENKSHTYWEVREQISAVAQPLECHAQKLRQQLDEVIAEYLPHDAPVGAYLSGGLDSSLVVALAKKLHSQPVHTYSIHFGDTTPHELEFSSLVAEHCKTHI